ncbi:MAG: type IV toxin-antitoxin system AbiEi family antitoxin [Dysgonamonadaceae bacterium]|jgi:hypothetical protein|nr:type IV toxin-antitoxin system AbiEi family antitoxin [Dysgonamonadaceae bacterium]
MINKTEIKKTKINNLMQSSPTGMVFLSSWLTSQGYPYELQQRYRKGGWLKSAGKGAMLKSGDALTLSGGLSALQQQAGMNIHIGGRSAFGLLGLAHYLQVNEQEITLFTEERTALPAWFLNAEWETKIRLLRFSLFTDKTLGLTDYQEGELTVKISDAARAMMECLYLCPVQFPLSESFELMEGLATLRPVLVQSLLEQCKSVKVKRLFLYFAEKIGHSWFKYLDTNKINIGAGDRSLAENGAYVAKYKLVLPKEIVG